MSNLVSGHGTVPQPAQDLRPVPPVAWLPFTRQQQPMTHLDVLVGSISHVGQPPARVLDHGFVDVIDEQC